MCFHEAEERGSIEASFALSGSYLNGFEGLPANEQLAFEYCIRAATGSTDHSLMTLDPAPNPIPRAMFALACFYQNGIGTSVNMEAAFNWYSHAANAGDPKAKKRLGMLGMGISSKGTKNKKGEKQCIVM